MYVCVFVCERLTAISFFETVSDKLEMVMVVMVVMPLDRERRGGGGGTWCWVG